MPEGGSVENVAAVTDEWVEMRVVDDGPGMTAQARENAFRRFGRSSTGGNGLGLGLGLVHRLAAANGAVVALAETPGGGVTAVLRLPAAR